MIAPYNVDELKERLSCRDLMQQFYPSYLVRSSSKYDRYFSPLREDGKKGGLAVYDDNVKDYGGNHDSWDAIALIQEYLQCDFKTACEWAINYLGGSIETIAPRQERQAYNAEPPGQDWQEAVLSYVETWERNLWAAPDILDYLRKERGLTDETIRKFRLGYNPDWQDIRCNGDVLKAAPGITIPWFADNQVYAVRIRTRQGSLADYTGHDDSYLDKYMSITGSRQSAGLFNADALKAGQDCTLLEGEFDAMLASQDGIVAITRGSAGDHTNISKKWLDRLAECSTVYSVLDNDKAGRDATNTLLKALPNCVPLNLPDGKDITDYIVIHGGQVKDLFENVSQAREQAQKRRDKLLKESTPKRGGKGAEKGRKNANMQRRDTSFSQWAKGVELPSIEATIQVNERYVSAIDKDAFEQVFNARSVLIKSAIGTGKTSLLHTMIEAAQHRLKQEPRVLIITHRQNLASDLHRRFRDLGFILYNDFQETDVYWQGHNRIICSYDSLHKLAGQEFDITAIDEFEQFIGHGWGGTMHKGENYRAFATLLHFIQNAKQFIGLDAHITQKSQDIVQQWRKEQVITLENSYRHDWGDLTLSQHDSAVIERAFNALGTANKPVVLLSSSRTVTNNLYQLALDYGISPEDIVLINADTSSQKNIQNYLANLNESIKSTKLLILSPSVDTGYDIQTPVHGVYAIFNDKPLIATKMLQMLNRCRNASERWAYVQYADNRDYETSSDMLEAKELSKVWNTAKRADFEYRQGESPYNAIQIQINRLWATWQADENKQRNMLFSSFIAYAQAEGYTIQYQDKQSAVFKDLYKQAKENLAERIKQVTLETEAISRDEYKYLKLSGLADETSRAGLNRWQIEDTVGRMITPELYDEFHNPRQRAALHQFMNLQDDIEHLKDFDRQEADNQTLIFKRKHLTVKFEVIAGAIKAVFGDEGLDSQLEFTADEIADLMANYLEQNMTSIALYLDKRADLSEKKINILRRILKRAGIKLNGRQVMVKGERFYLYSIDQKHLETWRDYARTGLIYRRLKIDYGDKARDYLKHVNNPLIRNLSNEQGEIEPFPFEGVEKGLQCEPIPI